MTGVSHIIQPASVDMRVPNLQQFQILEVVKQNVLTETATTNEMKENHTIFQHTATENTTTSTKSPEKLFGTMDNNIAVNPHITNGLSIMSTPKISVRKQDSVENLRAAVSEEINSPSTPSFCEKENLNSTGSSSSSETDVSRSPMSLGDSSLEVSPERTNSVVGGSLAGPKNTSTPLVPPPQQPARRRPGRPPGSTKKRMQTYAEYRKKGDSNAPSADDFSLRKFFEAGGRDYNEYLDWLKKRQAQQNATAVIMNQVPSYPNIPSSMIPSTTVVHSIHTTNLPQVAQFSTQPTAYSSSKNPLTLPPPPYRPVMVPRPVNLPPEVRSDMVSVPSSMPSIQNFPVISAPAPISPPHRDQTHAPQAQLLRLSHNQDSNALDLSAPARKRRSEGSSSSEDELPSPTSSSAKIFRDMSGSPVPATTTLASPVCRSPYDSDATNATTTTSPLYKSDINGNVTGATTENGEIVESSTEPDISSWDVENVVRFINSVPGCQEYSEVFREHKIDGTTLPHLSEEHLLNFVKMKLGPAIRLRLAIARLKPTTVQ